MTLATAGPDVHPRNAAAAIAAASLARILGKQSSVVDGFLVTAETSALMSVSYSPWLMQDPGARQLLLGRARWSPWNSPRTVVPAIRATEDGLNEPFR